MPDSGEVSNTSEAFKTIATVAFASLAIGTILAWQRVSFDGPFEISASRTGTDMDWQGHLSLFAAIAGVTLVQKAQRAESAGWAIILAAVGLIGPAAVYADPGVPASLTVSLAEGWYVSVGGGSFAAVSSLIFWNDLKSQERKRRELEFPRLDEFPRL